MRTMTLILICMVALVVAITVIPEHSHTPDDMCREFGYTLYSNGKCITEGQLIEVPTTIRQNYLS